MTFFALNFCEHTHTPLIRKHTHTKYLKLFDFCQQRQILLTFVSFSKFHSAADSLFGFCHFFGFYTFPSFFLGLFLFLFSISWIFADDCIWNCPKFVVSMDLFKVQRENKLKCNGSSLSLIRYSFIDHHFKTKCMGWNENKFQTILYCIW